MPIRRLILLTILLCLAALAQAPQPAIEQIQSLIDRGDYRPALDAANRLIAQSPRHSEAYRLRANARRNLNDLAGALEDANKAVELDPSNARALGGRSIVKRQLKDAPGALADVDRALAVQPGYHQGYDSRALLRQEAGDLAGALTDANRAIELSPQTPGYLVRRGIIRRSLKDPAGADRDLTKAIELAPANPLAYFQRGLVRLEQKRWDEAIADNTRAIDLKLPNSAAAYNNRALAYKNRGMLAEAPRAPAVPKVSPPKVAPEGDLEFLYRANFLRITSSGSTSIGRAGGNSAITIGGLNRYGFPVQWNGDEFYYSGPSFAFDKNRHPSTVTGGNIRLPAGAHLALGKVSPDGNRLLSLRLLTRGDDGLEFAIELRDIDLSNRQQSFDEDTLFLSNYSLIPDSSKAADLFKSTVSILNRTDAQILLEYSPYGVSVSLFKDPAVPPTYRSTEALPAVRTRLDNYWKRPPAWARIIALSEERFRAMFPLRSTTPAKPAP